MSMATEDESPLPTGTLVADKYRVERVLGHGGMGIVYAATHVVSGKPVALKWMRPTLEGTDGPTERFIQEARATARIDHPNVVDIYDVGVQEGSAYLVMELLGGESLADRLERGRPSPDEAVALLMPAMRGVAAAHHHGVIHRDLKPDNIFLCRGPDGEPREPKVLDFGISKIKSTRDDSGTDELQLTRHGVVMGTPHYMSPEHARGATEVDHRGDIYAFGVILYEMLTGTQPFDAETYENLVVKIATEDPVPIRELAPTVDEDLAAVVMRAMARDREARHADVAELARALAPHCPSTHEVTPFVTSPRRADGALSPATDDSLQPRQTAVSRQPRGTGHARRFVPVVGGILLALALIWSLLPAEPAASETWTATPAAAAAGSAASAPPQPPPQRLPAPAPDLQAAQAGTPADAASTSPPHRPQAAEMAPPEEGANADARSESRRSRPTKARVTRRSRPTRRATRGEARRAPSTPRPGHSRGLPRHWDEQLEITAPDSPAPPGPRGVGAGGGLAGEIRPDEL
ncbi:MAG: serine/threonine-protein kinase [Myxococcales bacterium]|jgi:serine/threonine-protein kinase